jgi:thiol-disulfide isomerase/thioredoxin
MEARVRFRKGENMSIKRFMMGMTAVLAAGSSATASVERTVLGEYFTGTWCDDCELAGPVVGGLIDEYPGTFAVVEYHVSDEFSYAWGEARGDYYADPIQPPWFQYDGLFDASPYDTYESKFITRQAVPTDVHIDILVEQTRNNTYEVLGQFCVEPDGVAKTARVYAVQVLDHWPTLPPPKDHQRNTFKQAGETIDLELAPGLCAFWSWQFTLDADSQAQLNDVKFVVWAQEALPEGPAEVYQAGIIAYPFTAPCPADVNSDGVVNIDDLFQVLGAWGPCDDCPEDVNDDGTVNIDDIFAILSSWGPCE